MLTELRADPARGLIGGDLLFGSHGPWVVQYWRSTEQLYAYAHDSAASHLPAWKAFNKRARKHPEAVGIWHEIFVVPQANIHTLYAQGAVVGLGDHAGTKPLTKRGAAPAQD